jgi:hypothetical protein
VLLTRDVFLLFLFVTVFTGKGIKEGIHAERERERERKREREPSDFEKVQEFFFHLSFLLSFRPSIWYLVSGLLLHWIL